MFLVLMGSRNNCTGDLDVTISMIYCELIVVLIINVDNTKLFLELAHGNDHALSS